MEVALYTDFVLDFENIPNQGEREGEGEEGGGYSHGFPLTLSKVALCMDFVLDFENIPNQGGRNGGREEAEGRGLLTWLSADPIGGSTRYGLCMGLCEYCTSFP